MSNDTAYPYNRIVQWLAGPVSGGVGLLFSWLAIHQHVVLPAGVKSTVATSVVAAVTFGVSAVVTYLAHHKWFTNLAHWIYAQQDSHTAAALAETDQPGKTTSQRADTWEPPTDAEIAEAKAALGGPQNAAPGQGTTAA